MEQRKLHGRESSIYSTVIYCLYKSSSGVNDYYAMDSTCLILIYVVYHQIYKHFFYSDNLFTTDLKCIMKFSASAKYKIKCLSADI